MSILPRKKTLSRRRRPIAAACTLTAVVAAAFIWSRRRKESLSQDFRSVPDPGSVASSGAVDLPETSEEPMGNLSVSAPQPEEPAADDAA
jgi:hypothetical protein